MSLQAIGSIAKLKDIIPRGQKNAISTSELMQIAGYENMRLLRRDIRRLRVEGEVILSSTKKRGGYYRPQDASEIRRFIRQEEHRAKSIFFGLKAARKLLRQNEDQMQISLRTDETTIDTQREETLK